MTSPADRFDRLSPPDNDGEILAVPPAAEWPRLVERNRALRASYRLESTGRPVVFDCDAPPLIATGHQPEFFHAGIWIKNVAAVRTAARVGGHAAFVAVDSDSADDAGLRWPVAHDAGLTVAAGRLPGSGVGVAFESLPRVSPSEWGAVFADVSPEWRSERTCLSRFIAGMIDGSPRGDYVEQWWQGVCAVDSSLGLASPALARASRPAALGPPGAWERLVLEAVCDGPALATAYNGAVQRYRAARGIRGARRPMPDLLLSSERVELPLWLIASNGRRARLFVARQGERIRVFADDVSRLDVSIAELPDALLGLAIRPRALMLTLFVRVFGCDLFIHGLGGAAYDQMTDELIRGWLGVEPPAYACATATLRLPLPRFGVSDADLSRVARMARDLHWNPQRHLGPRASDPVAVALLARREAAIASGERLRAQTPAAHAARRAAYDDIRGLTAEIARLANAAPPTPAAWAELVRRAAHDRIAVARDWFFALHTSAALTGLAQRWADPPTGGSAEFASA